jgi:hypothetical protein
VIYSPHLVHCFGYFRRVHRVFVAFWISSTIQKEDKPNHEPNGQEIFEYENIKILIPGKELDEVEK